MHRTPREAKEMYPSDTCESLIYKFKLSRKVSEEANMINGYG